MQESTGLYWKELPASLAHRRAVAYVSADIASADSHSSLDVQRKFISAYAAVRQLNIIEWFEDSQLGEKSESLTGYKALHSIIQAGQVDLLLVMRWESVLATVPQSSELQALLPEDGICSVGLISLFFSKEGVLMKIIIDAFDKYERPLRTARTSAGRRSALDSGSFIGGSVPFGYRAIKAEDRPETTVLVAEIEEAKIVRQIFTLRDAGLTQEKIAEQLNQEGKRTGKGGLFGQHFISRVLKRENFYRAVDDAAAQYKGLWRVSHPAILTRKTEE